MEYLKEKDKNYSGDMIRQGLVLVLVVRANFRLAFAEQTKHTLNSPEARGLCSKAVGQLVLDKKQAKQILDKIMIEQKAEEAAQRKREAQEKITARQTEELKVSEKRRREEENQKRVEEIRVQREREAQEARERVEREARKREITEEKNWGYASPVQPQQSLNPELKYGIENV